VSSSRIVRCARSVRQKSTDRHEFPQCGHVTSGGRSPDVWWISRPRRGPWRRSGTRSFMRPTFVCRDPRSSRSAAVQDSPTRREVQTRAASYARVFPVVTSWKGLRTSFGLVSRPIPVGGRVAKPTSRSPCLLRSWLIQSNSAAQRGVECRTYRRPDHLFPPNTMWKAGGIAAPATSGH